jgi:hypothetical protein
MQSAMNTVKYTLLAILAVMCLACGRSSEQAPAPDRTPVIPMVTHFIIGLDDQPDEYLLGRPVAVRTDNHGRIYIADHANQEIKVFQENGQYLHYIAGRGRGPGEVLGFGLMEVTPDSNLVIWDSGNFRYTTISFEGEYKESHPYNFTQQFHPTSIVYVENYIIGLMLDGGFDPDRPLKFRDLFYRYTPDFQTRLGSFGPFVDLELEETLPLASMAFYPGSMVLGLKKRTLFFSPGTYHGSIYKYVKHESTQNWEFAYTLKGHALSIVPYTVFRTEEDYQIKRGEGIPGVTGISGSGQRSIGRLIAWNSGLFMNNSGRLIHFYAVWADDLIDKDNAVPLMDLFVQVFNAQGELLLHSYVITYEERENSPKFSTVNWMDSEGNFYMIEYMNEAPVVRKFSLDFSILE